MQLSEVLGLSWSDIDFTERKINLRRQLVYIKKKGYYFTTLKTESSKRYILIDDFLLSELQRPLLLVKRFRWSALVAAHSFRHTHNTQKVQEQAFKLQEETLAIFEKILQSES